MEWIRLDKIEAEYGKSHGLLASSIRRLLNSGDITLCGRQVPIKEGGKRLVWELHSSSLEQLLNPKDQGDYNAFYKEWIEGMESGHLSGKPLSPKTVSNMKYGMDKFWEHSKLSKSVESFTPANLKRAIFNIPVDYEKKTCHFEMKQMLYKAFCSFYQLLIQKRLRSDRDFTEIREAKAKKRVFPVKRSLFRKQTLKEILKKNESLKGGRSAFDVALGKVIIYLGVYAGLRRGDLINLQKHQVDLFNNFIYIEDGKGHVNGTIGIRPRLAAVLSEWDTKYRPNSKHNNFLLQQDGIPLTGNLLNQRYRRLQMSTGIKVNTHGARRSFVTLSADEGVPISHLMKAARHKHIKTTMDYLITDDIVAAESLQNLDGGKRLSQPGSGNKGAPKKKSYKAMKLSMLNQLL